MKKAISTYITPGIVTVLRLIVLVFLASMTPMGASQAADYPLPPESWLAEANTQAFKQQLVGGNVEGKAISFEEAQLIPNGKVSQELRFIHHYDGARDMKIDVYLPLLPSYANRTFTIPTEEKGSLEIHQLRLLDEEHGQRGFSKSKTFCQGRVTFGNKTGNKLPGYICLRFGDCNIKPSELNGYFYIDAK